MDTFYATLWFILQPILIVYHWFRLFICFPFFNIDTFSSNTIFIMDVESDELQRENDRTYNDCILRCFPPSLMIVGSSQIAFSRSCIKMFCLARSPLPRGTQNQLNELESKFITFSTHSLKWELTDGKTHCLFSKLSLN